MKLSKIKELIGGSTSTKKLKTIISKISPGDFKKEMNKKDGSIINLIRKKLKPLKN